MPATTTLIHRVLRRRTAFTRGAAGGESRAQVVAANVDLVFAVCGLDADFNARRIERYLARIWASGAQPELILNKADLCTDVAGAVADVKSCCMGVPVHVTRAAHNQGLGEVRAQIQDGSTAAFVGSSGTGKSTLINALMGNEQMRTGEVRASDGRGAHTTTHRQLVLLPGGGLLIDTPGMRELRLAEEEGLESVFSEIAGLAEHCRFRDCRHESEPGCAVKEAAAAGELSVHRLQHFRKLERETQAYEIRRNERKRRQAGRAWGRLASEAARIRRWKESDS